MASGVIKVHEEVKTVSATLNSDAFTGSVSARKIGKLLLVSIDVVSKNDVSAWTAVPIVTLTGVTALTFAEFALVLQAQMNYAINGLVDANSNVVKLNTRTGSITAGNGLRGQCVIIINE